MSEEEKNSNENWEAEEKEKEISIFDVPHQKEIWTDKKNVEISLFWDIKNSVLVPDKTKNRYKNDQSINESTVNIS